MLAVCPCFSALTFTIYKIVIIETEPTSSSPRKDVVNGPRWPNYQMGSQRKVSLYSKLGWKPAALLLCNLDLCKIGQIQNAKSDAGRLPPYTDPQYHCPLIFTLCQTEGPRASMEQLCPSSLTSFLPSAEVWDCFFLPKISSYDTVSIATVPESWVRWRADFQTLSFPTWE